MSDGGINRSRSGGETGTDQVSISEQGVDSCSVGGVLVDGGTVLIRLGDQSGVVNQDRFTFGKCHIYSLKAK